MQVKPRSYPHPVLSHFGDDIVGSVFQPVVSVQGARNAYLFEAVFKTNNDDLLRLVQAREAIYAVHVECLQTRYRDLFTSREEKFSFEIPAGHLDGCVEVCSFVLATNSLDTYCNSGFHPDYAKLTFSVRKGDTLAVGPDRVFTAEKKSDPLRKVPSVFSIVPNEAPQAAAIDINTTGAKVIISLCRKNFDLYTVLRQSPALQPLLSSVIVVPALVAVIDEIRRAAMEGDIDAYADRRWFIVISRRLREKKVEPLDPSTFVDSSLKIAHELVGQPVSPALEALMSMEQDSE